MKRYVLFAGDDYYPSGGAHDYRGSFDTVEEAKDAPTPAYSWNSTPADWAHIADGADGLRIIWYRRSKGWQEYVEY